MRSGVPAVRSGLAGRLGRARGASAASPGRERGERAPQSRAKPGAVAGEGRLSHLPALLGVCGVLLVAVAVVGGMTAGGAGAAGAATGVAVVTASYLLSTVVIAWADSVHTPLVLPLGLATYVVKFVVIGVVMAAVAARDWAGLVPMGFGVIAGVVAWTATQIWWVARRHRVRLVGLRTGQE